MNKSSFKFGSGFFRKMTRRLIAMGGNIFYKLYETVQIINLKKSSDYVRKQKKSQD